MMETTVASETRVGGCATSERRSFVCKGGGGGRTIRQQQQQRARRQQQPWIVMIDTTTVVGCCSAMMMMIGLVLAAVTTGSTAYSPPLPSSSSSQSDKWQLSSHISSQSPLLDRRQVLDQTVKQACLVGGGAIGGSSLLGGNAMAAHAAESLNDDDNSISSSSSTTIGPILTLPVTTVSGQSYSITIPRVGYSFYKTPATEVPVCLQLALKEPAAIRHLDVATQYGTNADIGLVLQQQQLQRHDLFLSHKLSNAEQSTSKSKVKRAVKQQLQLLLGKQRRGSNNFLDLCSIHSPLTDSARRLATYEALLDLQTEGVIRAVGVCNYGVTPLEEIASAGFPPPSVIQLILSPFSQHKDVVEWVNESNWKQQNQHRTILSCSAWSKLSSAQGPQEGWNNILYNEIAKPHGMTKAQVLVRWAVQNGHVCVPRSGSKSKVERTAIFENSYAGTMMPPSFELSAKEMDRLNGLDENLPAGRLGIVDGWEASDIVSDTWDPTLAVV